MKKIIQIYKAISVKSIVYEIGDIEATVHCDIHFEHQTVSTKLVISLTDLNRMISKMASHTELENNMETLYLEDGSQLIEYNFKNETNSIIQDFHFNNAYSQIGA